MTDAETVYVATHSRRSSSTKTYHTDEDCRMLARAADYRSVSPKTLFDDMAVCSYCAGTWGGGRPKSASQREREPGNCRSCGATKRDDGTCPFCAACDDVGVVNGRHKWHRAARREGADD